MDEKHINEDLEGIISERDQRRVTKQTLEEALTGPGRDTIPRRARLSSAPPRSTTALSRLTRNHCAMAITRTTRHAPGCARSCQRSSSGSKH